MTGALSLRYREVVKKIEGRIACDELAAVLIQETVARFPGDYIEIGTLFGGTAILAAMICSGDVYAIDPMYGYYRKGAQDKTSRLTPSIEIFEKNLKTFDVSVTLFDHKHPPWPAALQASKFGVGLIDGDHTYKGAMKDYQELRHRCDCIIFDNTEKPDVQRVADYAMKEGWTIQKYLEYSHQKGARERILSMTVLEKPDD